VTAIRTEPGRVIALCGISGSGKSHCAKILQEQHGMRYVPSVTTRSPRVNEVNGHDKLFLSLDEFIVQAGSGRLITIADNFGNLYGHDRERIEVGLIDGRDMVLELRYDRIYEFRNHFPSVAAIYLLPENLNLSNDALGCRSGVSGIEQVKRLAAGQPELNVVQAMIHSDKNLFAAILCNTFDLTLVDEIAAIVSSLRQGAQTRNGDIARGGA
jgi:guanylate kinase